MSQQALLPEKFQFSRKVPETVTHVIRLDMKKGAMTSFNEFLDKISPLRTGHNIIPASSKVSSAICLVAIYFLFRDNLETPLKNTR